MRQRGAALPTVLALVSAVLVIGLAMGSLSTLSLQFNRRQLEGIRAEMAARSALAHLIAKMRGHDSEEGLNPLDPHPSNVVDFLPNGLEVQEGQHHVTIHFDINKEGYSRDNLGGDEAAVGWPDLTDDVARIPPYGLDVILNVTGPSSQQRFRAVLKRVWPFAVYSKQGPVALMSVPGEGADVASSVVEGDIYTNWMGEEGEGGIIRQGYGFGPLPEPSDVLANLEARAGYQPFDRLNHHLFVGLRLAYNEPRKPSFVDADSTPEEKFYFYGLDKLAHELGDTERFSNFSPETYKKTDKGNRLDGDFIYNHKLDAYVEPWLEPLSFRNGKVRVHRGPVLDPLKDISDGSGAPTSTIDSSEFEPLDGLSRPDAVDKLEQTFELFLPDELRYDNAEGVKPKPYLLEEPLVLSADSNPVPGGSPSTHYVINGSVSNRQVVYNKGAGGRGPGVYVRELKSGMRLQNVVLRVKGDLDLSSTKLDSVSESADDAMEIVGAGATLIVDGKLILGNAHINAQDQGFVIYARDIVLKGGGTFFGLMIAERSISILSQSNDLEVTGGLMCAGAGGIALKGTKVKHDPDYLKSINGGGDLSIVSWRKL